MGKSCYKRIGMSKDYCVSKKRNCLKSNRRGYIVTKSSIITKPSFPVTLFLFSGLKKMNYDGYLINSFLYLSCCSVYHSFGSRVRLKRIDTTNMFTINRYSRVLFSIILNQPKYDQLVTK